MPVKYWSTNSWLRPIASNAWAPAYEPTTEMPIFDMIFSTPLPSALMRFLTAFSGVMPGDHAAAHELLDGLHREVRVDRRGAVADEQGDVVHLAHVAGLDDEAAPSCGSPCG